MKKSDLAILFILSLFTVNFVEARGFTANLEVVRERVIENELENEVDEYEVITLINSMKSDGSWSTINYKDVSRRGFEHMVHLNNMLSMALAYEKPTSLTGDAGLKNSFDKALNFWLSNDFICDNWWWNQIGTPKTLTSLLLIMDGELSSEQIEKIAEINQRANLNATGARPSGDRIKIAGILAKNLLFERDQKRFEEVIKVIEGEIKFNTGKRGMQHDYSFHHRIDRVNNTTSYGKGYADAFAEWAAYTSGTKYAFANESMHQLTDYYLDGICKQIAFGKYTDHGVMNRGISRSEGYGDYTNTKSLERLLLASNYRQDDLREMIKLRQGELDYPKPYAKFFWQTEHLTLQRPGFFTSVRMHSVRNQNMEVPYNGEGLKNHHRGDGTNYLTKTGNEYVGTPPVYDWQKIPGATVLQKPDFPAEVKVQKKGTTEFAGAATDGYYAVVGYDFESPHDPLSAKKSWFFFDDTYVCLGTGISSTADFEVTTTLNQANLNGKVIVKSAKEERMLSEGERELEGTEWILHDGVGYVFPEKQKLLLSNKSESGSWYSINKQADSPKDEVIEPIFKLWLSHGNIPVNASYEYIVVPNADANLLNGSSVNSMKILRNTSEVQAVLNEELQICQLVFYEPATVKISEKLTFTAKTAGIVMLKLEDDSIKEITVSDPTRKLTDFNFTVNSEISKVSEYISQISNKPPGNTQISIKLPQSVYAGKSVVVKF